MPRCDSPHAWNSGAGIATVSRALIGIASSSGASASGRLVPALRLAPGAAGGAGREDHEAPDVRRRPERDERGGAGDLGQLGGADGVAERAPGDDGGELVVVEDHADALVGGDVGELWAGEAGVEEHHVGSDLGGGEHRDHEPAAVAGEQSDDCLTADAAALVFAGDGVAGGPQPVGADLAVVVDDRVGERVTPAAASSRTSVPPVIAIAACHAVGPFRPPALRHHRRRAEQPCGIGRHDLDPGTVVVVRRSGRGRTIVGAGRVSSAWLM